MVFKPLIFASAHNKRPPNTLESNNHRGPTSFEPKCPSASLITSLALSPLSCPGRFIGSFISALGPTTFSASLEMRSSTFDLRARSVTLRDIGAVHRELMQRLVAQGLLPKQQKESLRCSDHCETQAMLRASKTQGEVSTEKRERQHNEESEKGLRCCLTN